MDENDKNCRPHDDGGRSDKPGSAPPQHQQLRRGERPWHGVTRIGLLASTLAFAALEGAAVARAVKPHPRTLVGQRVRIHAGAVIGSDGFGYILDSGAHRKVPQIGYVVIHDDVEIGANTTIDRARFGRTWIQQGVKIDNLVQIAHNVVVGKNSIIVAQTGVSGSTRVGERVTMAGQVGIVGHVEIADGTVIAAQSGVSKSIPGGVWFGYPAVPIAEAKQQIAWLHRLGKLFARVKEIEKKLGL